jgi:hypothetical protein
MEVLKQSETSAAALISETEARLLSLPVEYRQGAMDTGSPLAADLSDRLGESTVDFDQTLSPSKKQ